MIHANLAAALLCGTVVQTSVPDVPDRGWRAGLGKPGDSGPGVSGLPLAGGRSFATLDAYLAHLREHAGPIDRPWYREVERGLFRLETGNLRPAAPPRMFTRAELERKFGFRR